MVAQQCQADLDGRRGACDFFVLNFEPGAWQCTEYRLTLHQPAAEDGSAEFWVEGAHQGTFAGIPWRTDPALRISTFALLRALRARRQARSRRSP